MDLHKPLRQGDTSIGIQGIQKPWAVSMTLQSDTPKGLIADSQPQTWEQLVNPEMSMRVGMTKPVTRPRRTGRQPGPEQRFSVGISQARKR